MQEIIVLDNGTGVTGAIAKVGGPTSIICDASGYGTVDVQMRNPKSGNAVNVVAQQTANFVHTATFPDGTILSITAATLTAGTITVITSGRNH